MCHSERNVESLRCFASLNMTASAFMQEVHSLQSGHSIVLSCNVRIKSVINIGRDTLAKKGILR